MHDACEAIEMKLAQHKITVIEKKKKKRIKDLTLFKGYTNASLIISLISIFLTPKIIISLK